MYKEWFGDCYDFETTYVQNYWAQAIENMIFRSLEQTENAEQIRQNILRVFADQQVVQWFSKRTHADRFEKKVSDLINCGQAETALAYCEEKAKRVNRHKRTRDLFQRGKGFIKKILG